MRAKRNASKAGKPCKAEESLLTTPIINSANQTAYEYYKHGRKRSFPDWAKIPSLVGERIMKKKITFLKYDTNDNPITVFPAFVHGFWSEKMSLFTTIVKQHPPFSPNIKL